jgi:hypothetical protein
VVVVLLSGALLQIENHLFNPVVHGAVAVYRFVRDLPTPQTPDQQMAAIAESLRKKHYTVVPETVAFSYYGPRDDVLVASPDNPANSTRSAELLIYAVPKTGRVRLLLDFRPRPAGRTPLAPSPIARAFVPRAYGIHIRAIRRFNGSPGKQALIDLYDPREPSIAVSPFLISQDVSYPHFSIEPLLNPVTTGIATVSRDLATRFLRTGGWANYARRYLYGAPFVVRNAARPHTTFKTFAASSYAFSNTVPFDTPGGVLTLAAGYALRGGDFPTPTVMQILVFHVQLTGTHPVSRAFSGVPNLVTFPPSASSIQTQAALKLAAEGLAQTTTTSEGGHA